MPLVTRVTADATTKVLIQNTNTRARASGDDDWGSQTFRVKNATATNNVFIDDVNPVVTADAYDWAVAEGTLQITLEPGEVLYCTRNGAADQTLHVLKVGR